VLLNILLYALWKLNPDMAKVLGEAQLRMFIIICNTALMVSELKFHTRIHERVVSAGDVVRNVMLLTATQAIIAYILMRHILYWISLSRFLLQISVIQFWLLLGLRLIERNVIKYQRSLGRNKRSVIFVGADAELRRIYERLIKNPTTGYEIMGYYAEEKQNESRIKWLGTISELKKSIENGDSVRLGDELYVCLSRSDGDTIRLLSKECDRQVTKFYYVPLSVESFGLDLIREYIDDFEIYTTHESPLESPANKMLKRCFDIVLSLVFLIPTAIIFPFIFIIIKIQSPGPVLFKQKRTGLDGNTFNCLKFRSMHVNKDADRLQATENDPRKFPFGNFMRKTNIDELPQLLNVLKGDMSIVGPRPHMLAHTELYAALVEKYMVRHFVKPGITGWAQVTGFRGETKELWQMEGRVKRDIWYMENWSIWLDIRIIWITAKTIFIHDKHAY
jgi:putative colanic acid biosynthesis UDP-glucose lipid carrier transferase